MKCSKCERENLTKDDFTLRHKGKTQRNSYCKKCIREIQKSSYHNNPKRKKDVTERKTRIQKENRNFILSFLLRNPCSLCGETDIRCLDFDHLDRKTKESPVSRLKSCSQKKIKEEMNKCRVLCANCHRKHTATQFDWYKDVDLEELKNMAG